RIEILFPILQPHLRQRILRWTQLMLADNVKAREQDAHGHYHYIQRKEGEPEVHSQLELCLAAEKIAAEPDLPVTEPKFKKTMDLFHHFSLNPFRKKER